MNEPDQLYHRAEVSAARMAQLLKLRAPKQIIAEEIKLLNSRIEELLKNLNLHTN